MLFQGRNRIRYESSRWGWTRAKGAAWHGGLDVEGMDDAVIRMPACEGKPLSGRVEQARIVTDRRSPLWEWGWYVLVRLDRPQPPEGVRFLLFAHCRRLLVRQGQRVATGDPLGLMGATGSAALGDPPYAHVHFECRQGPGGRGMDPAPYAGLPNRTGIYDGSSRQDPGVGEVRITVRPGRWYLRDAPGVWGVILGVARGGEVLAANDRQNGWYHTAGGWLSGAGAQRTSAA